MRDRAERGQISWPVPSTFLVPLSWSHSALCLIPSHHQPPVPSRLPLPVQLMGMGVQFSPSKRIISSETYIQIHVLHGFLGRQGPGACAAGQRVLITRLSNLNWSPPRMGMLMAPEVLAPQKSIAAALHTLPPSCLLCPFHLGFKCRSESHHWVIWFPMPADGPARGAAAGKWGAWEQGLGCAPGGMATGSSRCDASRRCWLRASEGGGAVKPVTQRWRGGGGLGGGCHVSKWLQRRILRSVGPNGCPEIKAHVYVHPNAGALGTPGPPYKDPVRQAFLQSFDYLKSDPESRPGKAAYSQVRPPSVTGAQERIPATAQLSAPLPCTGNFCCVSVVGGGLGGCPVGEAGRPKRRTHPEVSVRT